jgi:F-type H+-transporting ATPase subunit gamma
MSQLIQLRQRIKAINTIKKITHTMRLISMSSHTRLRSKEETLKDYLNSTQSLFSKIKEYEPDWQNYHINPEKVNNPLVILIGSQRGLCGNFNTILFHYFERNILNKEKNLIIIPVGKKAVRYCETKGNFIIAQSYSDLNAKTLSTIAHEIRRYIVSHNYSFNPVLVVSNKLKTFFIQKPHTTQIIPFEQSEKRSTNPKEVFYWEQSPSDLLDELSYQIIETQLQYLLFQSLLAEHAARFISMDNATRNVQGILEATQLQYNKLRQFKITKELSELSFSL